MNNKFVFVKKKTINNPTELALHPVFICPCALFIILAVCWQNLRVLRAM